MTSELPIALIGTGKMGRALAQLAPERGVRVTAQLGRSDAITREALRGAKVAIEITSPESAAANVRACLAAGCAVVVGTTGWYDELPRVRAEVERAGGAMLTASNFSLGVAIFSQLVAEAARRFAAATGFDVHLVETHHAAKKDAPSGTAKALAATAEEASGRAVPVTSVRVGSVPGTHELLFDAPFEQVRLVHEARDRRVFAEGALVAARWLAGRGPGVYTMQDVLSTDSSHASRERP
ncbi:MAG TPA: 4-hydroxy-tetrahydrodipicolinate reductase [Gemmatimonadaceae bacterium]|jgi:4-hydroxy-tetrahydrodipicolinate reductase